AAGGYYVYWIKFKREDELAGRADRFYDNGTFSSAANEYAQIAKLYPDSDRVPYYQFRAELSKLRHVAKERGEDAPIAPILDQFEEFMKAKADDPLLAEHAADVGASLVQLSVSY